MRARAVWKQSLWVAGLTSVAAPVNVVLHELAHISALEVGGVPGSLIAMGSAEPTGFGWTFESLRAAQAHYGAGDAVFVAAALAGPVFTLLVGYVGLWSFRRRQSLIVWSLAYSAVATRPVVNLLFLTPRVIDGSIDSSDEAIAAFFLDWPLWSLWWLLVVGVVCAALLVRALPRGARAPFAVTGFVASFAGFLVIEYLVNTFVFNLESWER